MVFKSPSHKRWTYAEVPAAGPACGSDYCEADTYVSEGLAPMKNASGLVTQHVCGNRIDKFLQWYKVSPQIMMDVLNASMYQCCNAIKYMLQCWRACLTSCL